MANCLVKVRTLPLQHFYKKPLQTGVAFLLNGHRIVSEAWVNPTINKDSMPAYGGYKNQFWGVYRNAYFPDSTRAVAYKNNNPDAGAVRSYINKNKEKVFYISYSSPEFYAEGILDEFIFVNPEKNLLIVRLGHNWKNTASQICSHFSGDSLMKFNGKNR